jgi:hypothetical protein
MRKLWLHTRFNGRRPSWQKLPALLWLAACAIRVAAAEPRFTASLDRDRIVVGEPVALTLHFEGGAPRGLPAIPPVAGIQIAAGISSSMNTSLGPDGTMSAVQSYTITLVPQQVGDFVIPPITADVEGKSLRSQPLHLKVLQSDPSAPPPDWGEKAAFLWLALPKTEDFAGEVVVAELRLYVRGDIRNISDFQVPPLAGSDFLSGKLVQGKQYQRRVGNTLFVVLPFSIALTPLRPGNLKLGPLEGSVVVNSRSADPFESFFGPRTQPRKILLSLDQQEVQVRALPTENVPPGFTGAVGQYAMNFSAGPTNVAVGDPITLRIQISGQGSLDSLTLPSPEAWQDFKTYPPTSKVDTQDPLGIQGTKTFEQVVVPQSADVKALPAFAFSFFDPQQKAYRSLSQQALPLLVRPGGSAASPTVANVTRPAAQSPPPSQDIVPIKQHLGTLAQIGPPLVARPWFLALQGVPLFTFLAAVLWRKHAEKLANNPHLLRRRQAAQAVRKGLAQLRQCAAENNSEEFFSILMRVLQEALGGYLDLPTSAITEAVIDEHLRPRQAPQELLGRLQEVFQMCNQARYAPTRTAQELAAIVPKVEAIVAELDKLK